MTRRIEITGLTPLRFRAVETCAYCGLERPLYLGLCGPCRESEKQMYAEQQGYDRDENEPDQYGRMK